MKFLKEISIPFLFFTVFFPSFAFATNLITGGTESCINEFGPNPCSNSVDGNTGTEWVSNNTLPAWWQYVFGSPVTINEVTFWTVDGNTSFGDFEIFGSQNGVDWDSLETNSKAEHDTNPTYPFTNCTAYLYYKVEFNTNWRGGDGYTGFYEIEGNNDTPSTCAVATSTLATSTPMTYEETLLISCIIIFMLSIMTWGFLFSPIKS